MSDETPKVAVRLVVNLTEKANDALNRQSIAEGLNRTTIVNRALQVYEMVMDAQAAGRTVLIGDDHVRII